MPRCARGVSHASETHNLAQAVGRGHGSFWDQNCEPPSKRQRTGPSLEPPPRPHSHVDGGYIGHAGSSGEGSELFDEPDLVEEGFLQPRQDTPGTSNEDTTGVFAAQTTHGGRRIRPTWKVHDLLPAASGEVDNAQDETAPPPLPLQDTSYLANTPTGHGHLMASTSPSSGSSAAPPSGHIIPARRTHAVMQDGDDQSDCDVPPKKAKSNTHPLTHNGTAFVIMGDMWRHFQTIIDTGYDGINRYSPDDTLPYRTRKMIELYKLLIKIAPSIPNELSSRGPQGSMQIAKLLEKGRAQQRSTDMFAIKSAIFKWHHFEPPVHIEAKHLRGFNHPQFGRMLCPAGYDWNDSKVREALCNGSKAYPAGSTDWPVFLWENEHVDNDDLHVGFLRSTWIVKALQYILLGPSAANPKNDNESDTTKNKANRSRSRKPRASIHGLRRITTGAIAYGAAQASTEFLGNNLEIFGVGDSAGKFNYGKFHHSLVKEMDEGMQPAEREGLLDWYTNLVLGPQDDYCSDDEDEENTGTVAHISVAARMRAQRAKEKEINTDASAAMALGVRNGN
ncbi:hypothetical protein B0H21DRAFT_827680 [Amylocystis lapponica]|nr:hypothetical protein B0H21DRAFT_827680 [Amylocystis lapponica]